MNKRGQGGSELRVQGKRSHDRAAARICQLSAEKLKCQRRRASSEIQGACSGKLEQCEGPSNALWRRHSRITSSTKSPLRSGLPPDECLLLDDVRFSGDWFFFFDSFREANYDFLACHLRDYIDEPDWPRWSLDHPRKSIALREQLRCFNPIFRLSNAALSFLHQSLLHGWCGHNEVLFATLLNHNGFAIADIGGKGRFTPPDVRENFYTESEPNSIGLLDTGDYKISAAVLKSRPREKQTLSSGKTSMFRNA